MYVYCVYIYIYLYIFELLWWFGGKEPYLPMQEVQISSLGGEDPLEKEMATHSSILTWEIPWTEEPGGLQSMWSQRIGYDLATKQHPTYRHRKF